MSFTKHSILAGPDSSTTVELSEQAYKKIAGIAYDEFGVDLRSGKRDLINSRLSKILRKQGYSTFEEYLSVVTADTSGQSLVDMMDALTTNHTSFFREKEHFDFLVKQILPMISKREKISIWSAASATGEEIYTILMVIIEALGLPFPSCQTESRLEVRGTDISTKALEAARAGVYAEERLEQLPPLWRKYFQKGTGAQVGRVKVRPELRRMAKFERLNLMEIPNCERRYPVIFCRNVMIYFDRPTQEKVVLQLIRHLEPDGFLLIGHSETLTGVAHGLKYVRPATYQKQSEGSGQGRGSICRP